jgi:hypothetical protein
MDLCSYYFLHLILILLDLFEYWVSHHRRFTENEYLWTISLWDLQSSLGDKFQLVLYDEKWRSIAASRQFVINQSGEPAERVWRVEGELSS